MTTSHTPLIKSCNFDIDLIADLGKKVAESVEKQEDRKERDMN